MNRRCVLAFVLTLVAPLSAGGASRMSVSVSPRVAHAPGRLVVRAIVERDARNREFEVEAESADYYRSSSVQLDGDRAARTTVIQIRNLPLGEYRVTATLVGVGGEILQTIRRDVIVSAPRIVDPR